MEGDAGSGQLTPTPPVTADDTVEPELAETRLSGRRLTWVIAGIGLAALVLAALGGLALFGHHRSSSAVTDEDVAVAKAKECITATQAPDVKAMAESQRKIVECSSENYAAQANLYSGLLFEAYQTVNAQVKVTDMRAAAEKHNPDGSIDVLVATRVAMSNTQQQNQELSYRLRVRMVPSDGTFKIDNIEPVSK
jgi:Mce-associated membrane protein